MTALSIVSAKTQLKLIFRCTVGNVFFCLLILENFADVYMSNTVHTLECDN